MTGCRFVWLGEKPSLIQETEKALNRVRAKISGDVQERAFAEARETLDAMERWFEEALRSNPAQESAAQDRYEVSDSEAKSLQNRQATAKPVERSIWTFSPTT